MGFTITSKLQCCSLQCCQWRKQMVRPLINRSSYYITYYLFCTSGQIMNAICVLSVSVAVTVRMLHLTNYSKDFDQIRH
jgi:hypothetical protein